LVVGLHEKTSYFFALKAINGAGEVSPLSNVVSVVTSAKTPVNFRVHCATIDEVFLRWDFCKLGTQWEVRYATIPITVENFGNAALAPLGHYESPYDSIFSSQGVETNLFEKVVRGLKEKTTYYFALKFTDRAGIVPPEFYTASATTPADPGPPLPRRSKYDPY